MKSLKLSKFYKTFIILLLFLVFAFLSAISYVQGVSGNLANSVFRLHVIANSDSKEDQELKLKVRDALISYMNTLSTNCFTKEDAIEIAKEHKKDFQKLAEKTIQENGFNYTVCVEVNQSFFPTKEYGDISLPAGKYDCLKVKIGEANGKNWWCVMFPPLCFVDVSSGIVPDDSKSQLKNSMGDEEYSLISKNDDSEINFKFKIIELIQNLRLSKAE